MAAAVLSAWTAPGWAQEVLSPDQCPDVACYVRKAQDLIASGDAPAAVALLKEGVARFPAEGDLAVLLGAAYLESGNVFWAIRTLLRRVTEVPEDCAARAWLAWAYFVQASLSDAAEVAHGKGCEGPEGARLALVRALVEGARGDRDAAETAMWEARGASAAWPADRSAWAAVVRRALPDHVFDLEWRLEVAGGYTSNALLGSPTDPVSGSVREGGSALGQTDLQARFTPWVHRRLRPWVEFQFKGVGFLSDDVRGLSWLNLTGRGGLLVGASYPRFLVAWRPEWLLLGQGDRYGSGPVWYYSAHRGEVEVEVAPWLLVFAGAGWRTFREWARSRFEADLGLGGSVGLWPRVALLWAATARVYRARNPAWNLWGGGGLAAVQGRLPWDLLARVQWSASVDAYPDSAGYDAWRSPERSRRDVLLKPGLSFWSPAWSGFRVGLQYDFSWRHSTLPEYGFSDHRVLLKASWRGEAEVLRPPAARESPVLDLPWGSEEGGLWMDRIQDLLRQDEQVQRSSSCVQ